MDLARFEALVRDPWRTRLEIEAMKKNAFAKGQMECAAIAAEVLDARFAVKTKRGSGGTPTTVRFLNMTENFDTGKAAYLWLIEKFTTHHSDALARYVALHKHAGKLSKGCRVARNALDLFPEGSKRRGNPAHYMQFTSGWFADTNLNHRDKFATLMQISYGCDLEYGVDWDFRVTGATDELRNHQEAVFQARELLEELLKL